MAGPKARPIKERFFSNVVKDEQGCWIYGNNVRYGTITENKRGKSAHKFSYELHKGPVPVGLFVCHTCDVKQCVNPAHLYTGTHEDNTRDIVDRDRTAKNSGRVVKTRPPYRYRNGRVLNKLHRDKLIQEYASGNYTQTQLAARYRISQATVSATIRGCHKEINTSGGKKRAGFYRRKMDPALYQEIITAYASGNVTQTELATRYNCTQAHISRIVHHQD